MELKTKGRVTVYSTNTTTTGMLHESEVRARKKLAPTLFFISSYHYLYVGGVAELIDPK